MFYSVASQWHTIVIIKMKSKVLCGLGNALIYLLVLCIVRAKFCQPFLIITDSQDKEKNSIFTFINALTDYIQFEKGDMLIIYTDGPSSEFKNRYIVKLVSMLSKKFQCKVSWKYFVSSHGKGVVDGIGCSAKSLVRKRVMNQGKNVVIVQNSADFYKVAKDDMKGVMFFI